MKLWVFIKQMFNYFIDYDDIEYKCSTSTGRALLSVANEAKFRASRYTRTSTLILMFAWVGFALLFQGSFLMGSAFMLAIIILGWIFKREKEMARDRVLLHIKNIENLIKKESDNV